MSNKGKLHIGFHWIMYGVGNVKTAAELPLYISGQMSAVQGILNHPKARANLAINDLSLNLYDERYPQMKTMIKQGLERGQLELVSMTHSEPIVGMLPYDEMIREVSLNMDRLEKTFGRRPRGAYNPEMGWDPVSAKVFLDLGVQWTVFSDWQMYKLSDPRISDEREMYRPAKFHTIEDGQITAVFASLEREDWAIPREFPEPGVHFMSYLLGNAPGQLRTKPPYQDPIQRPHIPPADDFSRHTEDHIIPALERLHAMSTDGDMLVLLSFDSETFYREPHSGGTNLTQQQMEQRYDRFLSICESLPFVEFTTVSDYLAKVQPQQTYYMQPSVAFFDRDGFGIWDRGIVNNAYTLNVQCHTAKHAILQVETLLSVAALMGKKVPAEVTKVLDAARDDLGLARHASGRGYGPCMFYQTWCSELAVAAIKKAEQVREMLVKCIHGA